MNSLRLARTPAHALNTPLTRSIGSNDAVESRLAMQLVAGLNLRAEALPHDVSERLRVARDQALLKARAVRQTSTQASSVVAVSARGVGLLGGFALWSQRAASVLPLLMLVAGMVVIDRWSTREQVLAAAEIDSQLLSDALPPAAYSDPGFAEYLRTAPSP